MAAYEAGQVFRAPYPFVRCTYSVGYEDAEGWSHEERQGWKPGVKHVGHGYGQTTIEVDGLGEVVLTVVSVHKPGAYPARVFFTRSWVNPDGIAFGKPKLRIAAQSAFTAHTRGYRYWSQVDSIAGREVLPWDGIGPHLEAQAAERAARKGA